MLAAVLTRSTLPTRELAGFRRVLAIPLTLPALRALSKLPGVGAALGASPALTLQRVTSAFFVSTYFAGGTTGASAAERRQALRALGLAILVEP